jgi:hypothetical protein
MRMPTLAYAHCNTYIYLYACMYTACRHAHEYTHMHTSNTCTLQIFGTGWPFLFCFYLMLYHSILHTASKHTYVDVRMCLSAKHQHRLLPIRFCTLKPPGRLYPHTQNRRCKTCACANQANFTCRWCAGTHQQPHTRKRMYCSYRAMQLPAVIHLRSRFGAQTCTCSRYTSKSPEASYLTSRSVCVFSSLSISCSSFFFFVSGFSRHFFLLQLDTMAHPPMFSVHPIDAEVIRLSHSGEKKSRTLFLEKKLFPFEAICGQKPRQFSAEEAIFQTPERDY